MLKKNIRGELGRIREYIQQKKGSGKITELFQEKRELTARKAEGKKISAVVRELEKDKRIFGAVVAHFDLIPQEVLDKLEAAYPETMRQLFDLSQKIITGAYGKQLQVKGQSRSEDLISWKPTVRLLIIHRYKEGFSSEEDGSSPEILEKIKKLPACSELSELLQQIKEEDVEKIVIESIQDRRLKERNCQKKIDELIPAIEMSSLEKRAFLKIFRKFLNNLANPSHVSVDMFLEKEKSISKTLNAAMAIKNQSERSKSLNNIVNKLFSANRVNKAIKVVHSIKAKKDVAKPLTNLVKKLLSPKRKDLYQLIKSDQINEAIALARSLGKSEEKDRVYQRIVSGLAKHDLVDKALEVVDLIEDKDIKSFALSSMVSALVSQDAFEKAKKIVFLIKDQGSREDAHSYIVRGLVEKRPFQEVIAYVDSLQKGIERSRAAKIILSIVIAHRETEKINDVRNHFALV